MHVTTEAELKTCLGAITVSGLAAIVPGRGLPVTWSPARFFVAFMLALKKARTRECEPDNHQRARLGAK